MAIIFRSPPPMASFLNSHVPSFATAHRIPNPTAAPSAAWTRLWRVDAAVNLLLSDALIFAAMRKFAKRLEESGWRVVYSRLDDTENAGSIVGELLRRAEETGASEVIVTSGPGVG